MLKIKWNEVAINQFPRILSDKLIGCFKYIKTAANRDWEIPIHRITANNIFHLINNAPRYEKYKIIVPKCKKNNRFLTNIPEYLLKGCYSNFT
jgi:hypothetical protein